jgi:8-hydroxy-5-deazaflavin:NADPH oxidoreductase
MQIGILGSGVTGQTVGSKLIHLGHEVMLGSRQEANPKLVVWAKEEASQHALYGTFRDAAKFGEIVFNCTKGSASIDALMSAGAENLKGKILIDTANPYDTDSADIWTLTICNDDSLGEEIQRLFPEARVVKTLNTVNANVMVAPEKLQEKTSVFVSGDDIEAKAAVVRILKEWFGWKDVIDLGGIMTARSVEMYIMLWHSLRTVVPSSRFNIKVVTS